MIENGKDKLFRYAERMRLNPTCHEKIMFEKLEKLNVNFRFQWIMGKYIVDFILPKIKVIIEVDGESHELNFDYDRERDSFLESRGFKVVRIKNGDVRAYNVGWLKSKNANKRLVTVKDFKKAVPKKKLVPLEFTRFVPTQRQPPESDYR